MPSAALKLVRRGSTDTAAKEALLNRLEHGLIRSVAKTVKYKDITDHYFAINPKWWSLLRHGWLASSIWDLAGDVVMLNRTSIGYGYSDEVVHLFEVRFETEGVSPLITKQPDPLPSSVKSGEAATSKNRGGRPPKDYWDDLWVEICRQLYIVGDLKPEKQANIEKAMLDWAVKNGHEMSEAAARSRARKLFNALKREG